MTHVSKKRIDPEIWKYITDSLTYLIKNLNSTTDTQLFLDSILSDTERLMISKRIIMAFLLKHNIDSENICEVLKLTPATVSRQKLWIQTHRKGFDIIISKMENRRKGDVAKEILYNILDYALRASSGNISAINRKKFRKGELNVI
jgi:uncharacterized protein YerC